MFRWKYYPSVVKRIGKKGRDRLIVVSMFCLDDNLAVLTTKLKVIYNYINDDLTPQQREHQLLIMCRNARSDGKKAFVKNGSHISRGWKRNGLLPTK